MAESNGQATDVLTTEEKAELENAFERGGIEELQKLILSKRDEWKSVPVNIAVTGASGVGKSTLINTFRGLTAEDEGGACADVKEATMKITKYEHPRYENIVFWDLPGVGTPKFPQSTYLKDVEFERYDFFLVLSVGRCREVDLWLCNEVKSLGKMFYFVRTQMHIEVIKDLSSYPKTHDKTKVVKRIRDDCEDNLREANLRTDRIFLIDSCNITDDAFDFDNFTTHIIDELPSKKQDALTLSMTTLTKGIFQKKKAILLTRIYYIAMLSAIGGAIPIPGINAMIDAEVTKAEIMEYRNQFGLPAKPSANSPLSLKCWRLLNSVSHDTGIASIANFIASYAEVSGSMKNAKFNVGLRIFGSDTGAVISYMTTATALRTILDELTEEVVKTTISRHVCKSCENTIGATFQ